MSIVVKKNAHSTTKGTEEVFLQQRVIQMCVQNPLCFIVKCKKEIGFFSFNQTCIRIISSSDMIMLVLFDLESMLCQ